MQTSEAQANKDLVAVINQGDEKYRVEVLGQAQDLEYLGCQMQRPEFEYARGKHFYYRRSTSPGHQRWEVFCGADLTLSDAIAKAVAEFDGYRRPMGCAIDDAPASRSIEFATALAVELNGTDDDAEIAKLAHEIDRHPNAFVLRVHRLEKRLAALEQQQLVIAGGHTE